MGNRKDGLRCPFEQDLTCTVVLKHRWERNEIFTCLQKVALLESTQDVLLRCRSKVGAATYPHSAIEERATQAP